MLLHIHNAANPITATRNYIVIKRKMSHQNNSHSSHPVNFLETGVQGCLSPFRWKLSGSCYYFWGGFFFDNTHSELNFERYRSKQHFTDGSSTILLNVTNVSVFLKKKLLKLKIKPPSKECNCHFIMKCWNLRPVSYIVNRILIKL